MKIITITPKNQNEVIKSSNFMQYVRDILQKIKKQHRYVDFKVKFIYNDNESFTLCNNFVMDLQNDVDCKTFREMLKLKMINFSKIDIDSFNKVVIIYNLISKEKYEESKNNNFFFDF